MKINLKTVLLCLVLCSTLIVSKKERVNKKYIKANHHHMSKHKGESEKKEEKGENNNGLGSDKKPLKMPVDAPDTNNDFQTSRSEFDSVIQNHGMTKFEGHMIFDIIDLNKDGALSASEWENFRRIFFTPFESCDKDGDYVINKDEVDDCLKSTGDFEFLTEEHTKKQLPEILDILQNLDKNINFAGYMYMRRTALGWRECVPNHEQMNRGFFRCAIDIASMGKSMEMNAIGHAFNIALRQNGLMVTTDRISYSNFLRLCWAYNLFLAFDQPISEGKITQKEFESGMDNNVLPTSVSPEMVKALFSAVGSDNDPTAYIRFPMFVILHMWWSKFHVLAGADGFIGWPEFCLIIDQKPLKYELMDRVDKCVTGLSESDLEKASLAPALPDKLTEKDYILFLEKKYNKKHRKETPKMCGDMKKLGGEEVVPNEKNRKILYNIVDVHNDGKIGFGTFIMFLKYSYSFAYLDHDYDGRVDAVEINKILNQKEEAITMVKKETHLVHKFLNMDIHAKINILQWLAYCFMEPQMTNFLQEGTKHIVSQEALTTVLDQVDLHIIPKDLQYATLGLVGRPNSTYNYQKAYRITLQTHARATTNYWFDKKMKAQKKVESK